MFKLITFNIPGIIHGLISLTDKGDPIFMDLIDTEKFSRVKNKLYKGVAGNLVAFACQRSFAQNMKG